MMKIRPYIYIAMSVLLTACAEDIDTSSLSAGQRELIGQGVNFRTSIADPFITRSTYRHDGSFNEGDIMTIYRQYVNDDGVTFNSETEAYRVYERTIKYAAGTSIALEDPDWTPLVGATGSNAGETFIQTEADSLTWENGKTVRFRSWTRSNLAGAIANSSNKYRYYPDYCVSEWVTVSGPTIDVSMTLKHQGCRIGLVPKSGNELMRAEICLTADDYKRNDNADTHEHDGSDKWSEEEAEAKALAVKDVYEKMCMPAGVDIESSLLNTLTQEKYNTTSNFSTIHAETDGIVKFNSKSSTEIAQNVQRPLFCANDGRLYMITIPYDMSTDVSRGETLTLPPFTRFKIWLWDVNKGDKNSDYEESSYHIVTLSDIKKNKTNEPMFPNGMELKPGYSYLFNVGYHYDHFTITAADSFSWAEQDAENGNSTDEEQTKAGTYTYTWWKNAIKNGIPTNIDEIYKPEFHITTQTEFLEFIKLVNGTAATNTWGALKHVKVPDPTNENPSRKSYRWYKASDNYVVNGTVAAEHVKDSVTHADAEAAGYIFYEHYYPANADQSAYSIEDYLTGPYSFYDENLRRHFVVHLDQDLDLYDWELDPIGNEETIVRLNETGSHPFRGVFDGFDGTNVHTLKNVNVKGGYLFKHCYDAAIRNLNIETVHDFKLVHTAEAADPDKGYGAYIVGISIKAPSAGNPIATELKGSSYVVGCIYQGRATGAMVGKADNLYMIGNMMAAEGLTSGTGALLGTYADNSKKFLAPQTAAKLAWGRFMVNYYDRQLSPGTNAVSNITDAYRPQEYIRGAHSYILKAKTDNLLSDEVPYEKLTTELMREGYYGLAPWKALNYAIWRYNEDGKIVNEPHNCKSHFVIDNVGYANSYPRLVPGEPDSDGNEEGRGPADVTECSGHYANGDLNVLEMNN